jgi:threonine aldolase
MIDLRSDTVTKPSKEMLQFMFEAEVGDDVFAEDPSILELQAKAASLFGKEAALYCPSGTMTNQIGIKVLSNPPGELICDELSHVYQYEGGGIAFNSGLSVRLLHGDRGRLTSELVKPAINPEDVHKASSQVLSVENTCNKGGGSIYNYSDLKELSAFARSNGLGHHLDGARIFNAIVESDYSAKDIGALFDTVSVCLSKGLGCPVGSVLLGSKDLIRKARRIRKVLGGGMRQAGYMAAAGIYALDHNIDRLKEDHRRARLIAENLRGFAFVKDVMPADTNIVVFELDKQLDVTAFLNNLNGKGVLAVQFGPQLIRFVTHLDFSDDQLNDLLVILKKI